VEDADFFSENPRVDVIVTEVTEDLDDPSKTKIKVQNFKDQFQDLFQKITATVQQAQNNTGSYEKAVALAEAGQERKMQFLTDALDAADARLAAAGQQSVTWGNDGITVRSVNSPCDAIRMIGGAILLSKQDDNG
jgi:U3 small nucleolar ribonucleoprotein component